MKTVEEYLNETISNYNKTVNDLSKFKFNKRETELFTQMIEQAQKDAYNQALEDAAKNVKVSLFNWIYDGFIEIKQNAQHYSINDGAYVEIDKESILKLKK